LILTAGLTTPVSSKTPANVAEMEETRNAHKFLAWEISQTNRREEWEADARHYGAAIAARGVQMLAGTQNNQQT